jgi:hypothetical protein
MEQVSSLDKCIILSVSTKEELIGLMEEKKSSHIN